MSSEKDQLSKRRETLNKSLSELIGLLDEVASGADDDFNFTDSDGNNIKLEINLANDEHKEKAIINLDIKQKGSNVFISIVEPLEQLQKELKGGNILNVPRKKK